MWNNNNFLVGMKFNGPKTTRRTHNRVVTSMRLAKTVAYLTDAPFYTYPNL